MSHRLSRSPGAEGFARAAFAMNPQLSQPAPMGWGCPASQGGGMTGNLTPGTGIKPWRLLPTLSVPGSCSRLSPGLATSGRGRMGLSPGDAARSSPRQPGLPIPVPLGSQLGPLPVPTQLFETLHPGTPNPRPGVTNAWGTQS
ncbi:pleckstrin homology domain-containing family A member 4 [Platysternon megacephalum]|uniref:Pleckstrin homology domain-containing family A member 4 n=1 Tax=Platysternon megacephalum TaxID=55544 RepID=A0A4D9DM05_9SAUR|nr:pleckstrin homology domain-containing family A member 4 [Platysternon megacephalum]